MKIAALIIDDDSDSRLILRKFLSDRFPDIILTGEAATVKQGLSLIVKTKPDLLLLDIELADGTGFDLLRAVPEKKFEVIFITAFDRFAVEAFRYAAMDYLLKPIAFDELNNALIRVNERIRDRYFTLHWNTLSHNLQTNTASEKRLAIATGNGYIFKDINKIVRLESHSNYTHFYFFGEAKQVSSHTLGYYEEMLPEDQFCRIHHSHIINKDYIEQYLREGAGGKITMKDGMELDISQRRKADVLDKLLSKSRGR
ncbi:MAG: LytTR family DNA-binding domain-containing protein [Bacteroidetes bacterium]|nr:LytTR family DNA-binding domain-containing protein [Bacteroidota bacterium]